MMTRTCTSRHTRLSSFVRSIVCLAAALALSQRGLAQESVAPIAAALEGPFTLVEASFLPLAEAMPAEKYSFKPSGGEFTNGRTFAEQVKHVACANFAFFNEIEGKEPPPACHAGGPHPARTKPELLAYLRESFAYGKNVLRRTTMANALEPVTGPYGGPSTRLGIATLAIWHASDHYGQLVVYLRLNGLIPPASQPATSR